MRGRHGHFKLESGHHADLWLDLESLSLNSREIRAFPERLAARLKKYQVDVVCGPQVEGAFLALLVSLELGCQFTYAGRVDDTTRDGLFAGQSRLPKSLQPIVSGKRIALVNDVITAGSAVRGTFFDLCEPGAEAVAIGTLLALGDSITEFAAKHGVALELLERMPHNLWQPAECPLCAAGIALE